MAIPKVFISYSHDSPEHKKWVLDLASKLRKNYGIDIILDQWELQPGADLPTFMEGNLRNADYVLMICTENYVDKANSGKGGVSYEKMIITADLMKDINSKKIIPIIRQPSTKRVPTFVETKFFVDLSKDSEFNFDELVRTIHQSPLYIKPEIGTNPFAEKANDAPRKTNDPIKEIMKIATKLYELGYAFSKADLNNNLKLSRIAFELLFEECEEKGLIESIYGTCTLTKKGKRYALDNNLINT